MGNATTAARVRELLDYDPATGVLTWRHREISSFPDGKYSAERKAAAWNRRLAGKRAGTFNPANGYRHVSIDDADFREHRIVWLWWYGEWPTDQIDHENHDRTDNRLQNLIESDDSANRCNLPLRVDNTSGQAGVHWNDPKSKWYATINFQGKRKHLGVFDTLEDAIAVRKAAERDFGYHENHGV